MIQRLRRQFIIVAMCSTLVVLAVIIETFNIVSYRGMVNRMDGILEVLATNDGRFPDTILEKNRNPYGKVPSQPSDMDKKEKQDGKKSADLRGREQFFLRETPYETRFFFVVLGTGNEKIVVDTGRIASVEEEQAISYAEKVLVKQEKSHKSKGFLDDYRYLIYERGEEKLVIFMDASKELQNVRNSFLSSHLISAIGMAAVFLLVVIFSRIVFRPVESSYRKQKQFITDASHELKTPITILSANVEVVELEWEENEWTKSMKHQLDRMVHMVDQMVNLSRMDEDTTKVRERFSLSEAVRDTVELFLPVAESNGKTLELSVQEGIFLDGDEQEICQLMGLLLDNAVKYASCDGEEAPGISVRLLRKGRRAEVILENSVEGMEPGNYDILFERFYRLDSSRNSRTGGSGIGLSIAKSIVERHRGRITACSRDGRCLEILVSLPLA